MTRPQSMCACGLPLHYTDPVLQRLTQEQVNDLGEYVQVFVMATGRSWMVQRHYIALHGLKARALPKIAEELGFKEVTEGENWL